MSLLDLILPTPQRTQEQLNTLIQQNILKVMSSSKFSSASAVTHTAGIFASGNARISNVEINQTAQIDTSVFLNDQTNAELQSDLRASLKNTIRNASSNMPFGQQPNVNTRISNVVDNSIRQSFTRENMTALSNAVNQVATITAIQSGQIHDARINQRADIMAKFASDVATSITSQLVADTGVTNESDTKTTNFIAEIAGAVGSVFTGPIIAIIVAIAAIILVAVIMKAAGGRSPGPVVVAASQPQGGHGFEIPHLPSVGGRY